MSSLGRQRPGLFAVCFSPGKVCRTLSAQRNLLQRGESHGKIKRALPEREAGGHFPEGGGCLWLHINIPATHFNIGKSASGHVTAHKLQFCNHLFLRQFFLNPNGLNISANWNILQYPLHVIIHHHLNRNCLSITLQR